MQDYIVHPIETNTQTPQEMKFYSEYVPFTSVLSLQCSPMTEYNSTVVCGAYVDTYLAECPGETCVSVVDVSDNADDDCTVSVSAAALSEQRTVSKLIYIHHVELF